MPFRALNRVEFQIGNTLQGAFCDHFSAKRGMDGAVWLRGTHMGASRAAQQPQAICGIDT